MLSLVNYWKFLGDCALLIQIVHLFMFCPSRFLSSVAQLFNFVLVRYLRIRMSTESGPALVTIW